MYVSLLGPGMEHADVEVESLCELGQLPKDLSLQPRSYHHELQPLIPVILGLGYSKLRHKLGALIHQFAIEAGRSERVLKRYCSSVLSICTDMGAWVGLARPAL